MQYYGNRLSENISRREPEGYLLCLNVPVARTGTQDYLPEELGLAPGSFSFASGPGLVSVYRPEEEVFAPETMASFEGMPVTNDHPPDGVDVDNIISPCKWCAGIGSGSTDRMVVYMNQVDRVCFNLTQPLRRMETEYAEMRIKIPYIAQFSEVRFLYPSTVRYVDGI